MNTGSGLVEQALKIDVHAVFKAIRRSRYPACTLTWMIGGGQISGVAAITQNRLVVCIADQVFGAEMRWCRPHFGGISASLACPSCARTMRTLFVGRDRMECRQCSGLKYKSQFEHGPARARRKALKVLCRIAPDHASLMTIPARRTGMHRKTYMRAVSTVADLLHADATALHEEFLKLKDSGGLSVR